MRHDYRPLTSLLAAALATGCGGVSEQRVSALEAQVIELQTANGQANEGDQVAGFQAKVAILETRLSQLEQMQDVVEALQKEAAMTKSPSPAEPEPSPDGEVWYAVDTLLGMKVATVATEGDAYTISGKWLKQQLAQASASGKGLKLSTAKKGGIAVKGIKPTSLLGQLGLKNRDVIVAIGDKQIASVEELAAALRSLAGPATVRVMRGKKELTYQYSLVD